MEFCCIGICKQKDFFLLQDAVGEFIRRTGKSMTYHACSNAQELFHLAQKDWDAMLVFWAGAEGMEIANGARQANSKTPLVWISDDRAFATHSYRLKAKAFLCQKITKEDIAAALMRCTEDS